MKSIFNLATFGTLSLGLALATPSHGFKPYIHEAVTREALAAGNQQGIFAFSDEAVVEVVEANLFTDILRHQSIARYHFDDDSISAATSRLVNLRIDIVRKLTLQNADGFGARRDLGIALHTIQDFYAHSNWIELGNTQINPSLGRERAADPTAGSVACGDENHSQLAKGYRELTTGFFQYPLCVPPEGRCRHGVEWIDLPFCPEGLNKDEPDRPGHGRARSLASLATRDYVAQILADLGGQPKAQRIFFGQTGPLVAVIDTTASMEKNLAGVRAHLSELAAEATHLSLVTFGDPAEVRIGELGNVQEFQQALARIEPFGGGAAEEPVMAALSRAVESAGRGASIYLATDADAKDCSSGTRIGGLILEKKLRLQGLPGLKSPAGLCGGGLIGAAPGELRTSAGSSRSVEGAGSGPRWLGFEFVELKGRMAHQGLFPLEGEPAAGTSPMARARLAGLDTVPSFRLVSLQGLPIGKLDFKPETADTKGGGFVGQVPLPGQPFRVQAFGTDRRGLPFEVTLERVLRARTMTIQPVTAIPYAPPGGFAKLDFRIDNAGPGGTFSIDAWAVEGGKISAIEPRTLSLAAGQSAAFTVKVAIPATAAEGSTAEVLVGASSGAAPGAANSAKGLVLVTGNRPPLCPATAQARLKLWPHDGRWVAFELASTAGVKDPDGETPRVRLVAVTQDEPVVGPGPADRQTRPDALGLGTGKVELRAERDPGGDGRVYRIAYEALDPGGFSCAGSFDIQVPATQGGIAIDSGQIYDSAAAPK